MMCWMEINGKKCTCIRHLLMGALGLSISTHFMGLFHLNLGTLQTLEARSE